jgi:hypothetical protein
MGLILITRSDLAYWFFLNERAWFTIRVTIVPVILSEAKNLHEDAVFLRDSSLRSE